MWNSNTAAVSCSNEALQAVNSDDDDDDDDSYSYGTYDGSSSDGSHDDDGEENLAQAKRELDPGSQSVQFDITSWGKP